MRHLATLVRSSAAAGLLFALAGTADAQDCSVPGQNAAVRDILFEFYLWYRDLPGVDPALFESPQAYLDAVRFRPLDTSFSFTLLRTASCSAGALAAGAALRAQREALPKLPRDGFRQLTNAW